MRPTILALTNCYPPGFKGGGPVRSLLGMQEQLHDELDLRVVTLDRDKGDTEAFADVTPGKWQSLPQGPVMYLPPARNLLPALIRVLRETKYDLLYVNSLFCPWLGIPPVLLRYVAHIPRLPLLVAPRGQLSEGALGISPVKKRAALVTLSRFGFYRDVHWHATAREDAAEIRRWFGREVPVWIASDLSDVREPIGVVRTPKIPDRLRLVFISRIVPKKNLEFAVRALAGIGGNLSLDVWGPVEDASYADQVKRLARVLAPNVRVQFCGPTRPEDVCATFARYDAFLFPTLGENFGHVILEALLAGCPTIVSDRTPWKDIEPTGAGWTTSLDAPARWFEILSHLTAMDETEHAAMSARSLALARKHLANGEDLTATREMFLGAIAGRDVQVRG